VLILSAILSVACGNRPSNDDGSTGATSPQDTLAELVRSVDFDQISSAFDEASRLPMRVSITTEERESGGAVLGRSSVTLEVIDGTARRVERSGPEMFPSGLVGRLAPAAGPGPPGVETLTWLFPPSPAFTDPKNRESYAMTLTHPASPHGRTASRLSIRAIEDKPDLQLRKFDLSLDDAGQIVEAEIERSFHAPLFSERTRANLQLIRASSGKPIPGRQQIETRINAPLSPGRLLKMVVVYQPLGEEPPRRRD
jgi:hypothetical protein